MQEARVLGNYIEHLAKMKGLSISDLGQILECSEHQIRALIKGRAFASFAQMTTLAEELDPSVEALLLGDKAHYDATVVHCMNEFEDENNREFILDLIDDYIDIVDVVTMQ